MAYRCAQCGEVFDKPFIHEWSEPRPDCYRERFKTVLCPWCGDPYFDEIREDDEEEEDDGDCRDQDEEP